MKNGKFNKINQHRKIFNFGAYFLLLYLYPSYEMLTLDIILSQKSFDIERYAPMFDQVKLWMDMLLWVVMLMLVQGIQAFRFNLVNLTTKAKAFTTIFTPIYYINCVVYSSVEVLKPRSCLSVCRGPESQIEVLSVCLSICPFVCPSIRLSGGFGSLVSLFYDGGYILYLQGRGPSIKNCNKASCESSRVSRLIFMVVKIIIFLVIIYLCGSQTFFGKKTKYPPQTVWNPTVL